MAVRGAKSFASLGAGLLGRSGARRVPLSFVTALSDGDASGSAAIPDISPVNDDTVILPAALQPQETPLPEVVLQVMRLTRAIEADSRSPDLPEPAAVAATPPAPTIDVIRPKAFTLRLDADHHRRLRAIVQAEGRSAQRVLIDALDNYNDQTRAAPAVAEPVPATPSSPRRTMTGSKP
ncbi:hypothetical protein [Novosphingobium sp.]|uniref:hypothetical protein n=1 Tax=Novosphingobium sp. TaxID=1874826 RepID=UPI0033400894